MKKIGILYHPMKEPACALASELERFLTGRNIMVWLGSAWEKDKAKAQIGGTDLILSVGGDGTILRAAQIVIPDSIPITGINLGNLGFMTEFTANEAISKLPALLVGEGWLDERVILDVQLHPTGQEHELSQSFYALNDVVIARGAIARMVHIATTIDGARLTTYRADGVIVATATGSTGYALAASGPILYPQSRDFVLSPILPHLGLAYSLVVPSTSVIKLQVGTDHEAAFSIDGHINLPLQDKAIVTVKLSAHATRFLRLQPRNSYYSTLEQKLKGKQ